MEILRIDEDMASEATRWIYVVWMWVYAVRIKAEWWEGMNVDVCGLEHLLRAQENNM